LRKAPALRNNNGALQVRVRLDGQDHFINRLGRWDDPIAVAKAQAISAAIWRDYREGKLDWSLCRYKPLVEGKDPDLLKALEDLMLRKRQGRTTHAYRSKPWREACSALGLIPKRTRPYTPRTNGKAERFIKTLLAEWAYSMAFQTSQERNRWLPRYLAIDNGRRCHMALAGRTRFSSSDCCGLLNDLVRKHT